MCTVRSRAGSRRSRSSVKAGAGCWFFRVTMSRPTCCRPPGPRSGSTSVSSRSRPSATGQHVDNPRWARAAAARLAAAQQRLARARRGGKNRAAKRETVAARHRKIANQRKDFHHKQARELAARYDLIVVEDLKIANMLRRPKPVPDPDNPGQFLPNGAWAKAGLNRRISDAGWGQFVSILRAKAEDAGRVWIEVDPRHTSDRCESCGHAAPENRVTQAEFVCQRCGHTARQTNTPHATSSGLDWPYTPKPREKKLAASAVREVTSVSSCGGSSDNSTIERSPNSHGYVYTSARSGQGLAACEKGHDRSANDSICDCCTVT